MEQFIGTSCITSNPIKIKVVKQDGGSIDVVEIVASTTNKNSHCLFVNNILVYTGSVQDCIDNISDSVIMAEIYGLVKNGRQELMWRKRILYRVFIIIISLVTIGFATYELISWSVAFCLTLTPLAIIVKEWADSKPTSFNEINVV